MQQTSLTNKMHKHVRTALAAVFVMAVAGCGNDSEPTTQNEVAPNDNVSEKQERSENAQTEKQPSQEAQPDPVIVVPAPEDTSETSAKPEPVTNTQTDIQSLGTYVIEPGSGDSLWNAAQIHYDFAASAHTDIANAVENVADENDISASETVSLASDGQAVVLTMPADVQEATGEFDWQAANQAAGLDLN